jgi:hypothetical protein
MWYIRPRNDLCDSGALDDHSRVLVHGRAIEDAIGNDRVEFGPDHLV